jgi:hypothetical protein
MGGRGSGRYCRWSNTTTLEEVKRIDIRYMRRQGLLRPNWTGSLTWTCRGEPAGDIRYACHADRIVFNYRFRAVGSRSSRLFTSIAPPAVLVVIAFGSAAHTVIAAVRCWPSRINIPRVASATDCRIDRSAKIA